MHNVEVYKQYRHHSGELEGLYRPYTTPKRSSRAKSSPNQVLGEYGRLVPCMKLYGWCSVICESHAFINDIFWPLECLFRSIQVLKHTKPLQT